MTDIALFLIATGIWAIAFNLGRIADKFNNKTK